MIFVTVGTTKFPFDRLLKAVDKVMVGRQLNEELIIQKGTSTSSFNYSNKKIFKEIAFDQMIANFKRARVVVTSGGPAAILLALKYCRNQPLVVPRAGKLGEHINDHQLYFSNFLDKKKMTKVVWPGDDLVEKITEYLKNPAKITQKNPLKADKRLIKNLINYTEKSIKDVF